MDIKIVRKFPANWSRKLCERVKTLNEATAIEMIRKCMIKKK